MLVDAHAGDVIWPEDAEEKLGALVGGQVCVAAATWLPGLCVAPAPLALTPWALHNQNGLACSIPSLHQSRLYRLSPHPPMRRTGICALTHIHPPLPLQVKLDPQLWSEEAPPLPPQTFLLRWLNNLRQVGDRGAGGGGPVGAPLWCLRVAKEC